MSELGELLHNSIVVIEKKNTLNTMLCKTRPARIIQSKRFINTTDCYQHGRKYTTHIFRKHNRRFINERITGPLLPSASFRHVRSDVPLTSQSAGSCTHDAADFLGVVHDRHPIPPSITVESGAPGFWLDG